VPDTPDLEAAIAEMLRDGATYAQIRAALGPSATYNVIAAVRREHTIPVVTLGHPPRGMATAYAAGVEATGDGHARWAGPWSGRGPEACFGGRRESARRVAFRLEHGREPVGHVKAGCGQPWCVARGHVEDRPMREQLRAQLRAIGADCA